MNARGGDDARAARLSLSRVSRSAGADSDGEDRRVLVLDLGGDVDEASRRAVTALVAKDIAAAGLSVLSGDDLRNMADLESQRQDAGCSSDESCLVEIADAMNARLVVSGFVGRLGKLLVVNLSLFDARSAQAHGRATVEADSLEDLPRKLEPAVRELVDDFRPQTRVGTGVFAAVGGGADDSDAYGDGNECTVSDVCRVCVCVGVDKDCGDDLCVAGVCQVVGSCEALPSTVVLSPAGAPRIAANALDGELGVAFEASVLDRTEVFFARIGVDGGTRGAPVQLTDGTPATQDDASVSSFVRDIAFAPEERRFGVLAADSKLLSSAARLFAVTNDGIVVDSAGITNDLGSAFQPLTARLDWSGSQFIIAARIFQQQQDTIILDDVDADGSGADLIDAVIARGNFAEIDIAARRGSGEVGVVFVALDGAGAADTVRFVPADADGDALVERTLSTGRPPGRAPAIAASSAGYVVVWQEGEGAARALVAISLDVTGTVNAGPTVVSDDGEAANSPASPSPPTAPPWPTSPWSTAPSQCA